MLVIRVIIPAYNEAGPLQLVLSRLPGNIGDHEIIPLVVSDGSTDDTEDVARAAGCEVLALHPNQGKGAAVGAGLESVRESRPDIVVLMDADGQHDPDDLEALVAPLLKGTADIAVGSRYATDEHRGDTPRNRYAVRWTTVAVLESILGVRFTDPYCGFRAFSRVALEQVEFCGNRYEGELEALFDACRCGLTVTEVPIKKIYGAGTSKMSADGGRVVGRLKVIGQYARTIVRKRRELRAEAARKRRTATG